MIGDQDDMIARIRAVLPTGWFPDVAPVLDGLLAALAWVWAWAYDLVSFGRSQTRLATASGVWIDMFAADFFGGRVLRRPQEADDVFRVRVTGELVRERGTRAAVAAALTDLTGRAPAIFEPALTSDTGGWGGASASATGLAYGSAGGWGTLALPFQFFVTAFRAAGQGIPGVSGWGGGAGGYGSGAVEYAALSEVDGQVSDVDINRAVADVLPAATIAWMQIT